MFFIYLCAEQTPRCVSLVSCVTMMKGTCCSQQKPLSTLRYRHPACIIHKSSGNSVTAHSLNFCDMGWRETQDSSVDPCPYVTFSRRENGAIMLMTSSSLCITFILPMRSENTFQTAWNVFHPVTQLLCFDAVQKLLHKTNSSASMQDSLCAVMFFVFCCQNLLKNVQRCFLVYFKDPVWTVLVISEIFLSVICSLVRGSVENKSWRCVFACTNQDWAIF